MLLLFLLVSPFFSSAQSPPPPTTLPSGTIYYYTTTATGQTFTSTWLLTPHPSHALITSPPPQQCNSFSAIWTMAPFGTEGGPYMYYDGYLGCRAWPTDADATGRPERQCCPDGFDGLGYYTGRSVRRDILRENHQCCRWWRKILCSRDLWWKG